MSDPTPEYDPWDADNIRREHEQGKSRGGSMCCGTTGVQHRWFCFGTPLAATREDPPPRRLH